MHICKHMYTVIKLSLTKGKGKRQMNMYITAAEIVLGPTFKSMSSFEVQVAKCTAFT